MKTKMMRKSQAITLIEVLLVITVLLVLAFLSLSYLARARSKSAHLSCLNNLKEISTGYRLWAGDNGDLPPFLQKVKKGGWADFLTNANQGAICWTNYAIMENELGEAPMLVVCPDDERKAALSFSNDFDNTHVSYFVGVNASDIYPQSIMGGDRSLGPGTKPDPDYGYSPKSGKGNDVIIPISGAVSWSLKVHPAGSPPGTGNILLGDGSGQQVSTKALNEQWLPNAQGTNNWPVGHIPATPSIRLVFP
jgi:competence protein ComGC